MKLPKCPECGSREDVCDTTDVLVEEARSSTELYSCANCEVLWGRYS